MFFGDSRISFLNQLARLWATCKESIQKEEHNHHCLVFKVLRLLSYCLSCEKIHDNKEFSGENSKPCLESRITTH